MKILALRGENLASLSGKFELNFREGALAEAGLFAITGETGSGKSTILDALCLALYGEYPRLSFSSNERTPDIGGDDIQVSDARNVMRRGAGACFAEVDFEARDGGLYRVRWAARRSNDKPSGKLQAEKFSLMQLPDQQGIADKKTDVVRRVQQLTGLTFEQFRRTCLLAQGQFDAFLISKEADRTELLERITGTEIYSRISKRVHERTREEAMKAEAIECKVTALNCMSEEERLEAQAERERLALAEGDKVRQLEQTRVCVQLWVDAERAQAALSVEELTLKAAEEASQRRKADRERLEDWNRAERFRELAMAAAQAGLVHKQLNADLLAAKRHVEEGEERTRVARQELERSQAIRIDIARQVEQFSPVWLQAEALDTRVEVALTELNSARHGQEEKQSAQVEAGKKVATLDARLEQLRSEAVEVARWLEARAGWLPGFQQRRSVGLQLAELERLPTVADQQQKIESLQAEMPVVDEGFDADGLEQSAQARSELLSIEDRLRRDNLRLLKAEGDRKQIELQIAESKGALVEASRVEQSFSSVAEGLRAELADGVPCPVCGSLEHPILQHAPEQFQRMAADHRERVAGLKKTAEVLEGGHGVVLREEAGARAAVEQHQSGIERVKGVLARFPLVGEAEIETVLEQVAEHRRKAILRARMLGELVEAQQKQVQHQSAANIRQAIGSLLEPFGASAATEFEACCDSYQRQLSSQEMVKAELGQVELQLSASRAALEAAEQQALESSRVLQEKSAHYEDLKKERRGLLEGKPVAAERAHYQSLLDQAVEAYQRKGNLLASAEASLSDALKRVSELTVAEQNACSAAAAAQDAFARACELAGIEMAVVTTHLQVASAEKQRLQQDLEQVSLRLKTAQDVVALMSGKLTEALSKTAGLKSREDLELDAVRLDEELNALKDSAAQRRAMLESDDSNRLQHAEFSKQLLDAKAVCKLWSEVNLAIGHSEGSKFRKLVQCLTLDGLVQLANHHLKGFSQRYRLARASADSLGLQIVDAEMGSASRAVSTLSGGERFLVSLGLALALSGLEGKESFVDALFIDEGFGTLDSESLDQVMVALESLPASGRRVGVITHVAAMMDRIAVQVRVQKMGNGRSRVKIVDASRDSFAMMVASGDNGL